MRFTDRIETAVLNEEGLLTASTSVLPEDIPASPAGSSSSIDDDIPCAQIQRPTDLRKERQEEQPPKPPRKRRRDPSRGSYERLPKKRPRQTHQEDTAENIKEQIRKSELSISKLKTHSEKGTCPKTLRYDARASIAPDEEFKKDISLIRKNAQQKYLGALIKYHYRRVERNKNKLRRIQQLESRKSTVVKQTKNKALSTVREPKLNEHVERISNIQKRMKELEQMMSEIQRNQNKESESYPTLCSLSTVHYKGKKGKTKRVFCNKKRKERRKTLRRDINQKKMESMKRNIKNLSNNELTRDQITLLSRGLKFIPTPVANEDHIRRQLLNDHRAFARRMRLKYIFHGQSKEPHPFHVKSNWEPPIQPSVALETYL